MWNYPYNPYYSYYPAAKTGMLSKLFQGFSFQKFLDGTQKTLGLINQVIPVYNQMKPLWNNAKTMFRIVDELKASPTPTTTPVVARAVHSEPTPIPTNSNMPVFFSD